MSEVDNFKFVGTTNGDEFKSIVDQASKFVDDQKHYNIIVSVMGIDDEWKN